MTELPPGWVKSTLGEIGQYLNGRGFKKSEWREAGRPIIRIQNLTGSANHFNYFDGKPEEHYTARAGDLLVSWAATLGVFVWKGPEAVVNQHIFKVQSYVDRSFHRYLLLHVLDDLRRQTHGSGMVHITKRRFEETPAAIPPLAEQRRIVAAIEEHFSRLDAAGALLSKTHLRLRRLRESALGHLLAGDWTVTTLGDLAERITKGTTPTSIGHGFSKEGVLFVKAESLAGGVIDHARCAHIDDQTDEALSRSRLAEDDILVTIAGTLGRVARVRARDVPANTNQAVSLIRLRDRTLAPWVLSWLQGPLAQRYLRRAGRGVGLQNLNLKQVAETPIHVAPQKNQDRIVADVERQVSVADAIAAQADNALRRSAALRRSILAQAFTGKLVAQDPSDEPASVLLVQIAAARAAAPTPSRRKRRTRV